MVGDRIFEAETTEPTIGQVQMDFFTQPSLRPDAVAIADQQHPDHQLRIN